MLKYRADLRTVLYMIVTTATLIVQWNLPNFNIFLFILSLYLAIATAVIAHNHNHVGMWRSKFMNTLTDYWLTLFYGFPAFGWIPTHNKNHHKLNNKEGDYTITYRYSEKNNLLTLMTYPTISSYFQQTPIYAYLGELRRTNKTDFYLYLSQYVVLAAYIIGMLLLDWQKALLYIIIPHQVALYSIMIFNYVQHVHADEESDYNHSRNILGLTNQFLFNNGYHTIHHIRASIHWSELPEAHRKIEHLIDPSLNESGFWSYIFRNYFVGLFAKHKRTTSMRLARMGKAKAV
ncbi:MAG TPA: fatty acid desaturase [Candidatus Kapabacteria bacterium]|nr:fatty acid desaturase [Candidatus Kapabacteria bacterium]